MHGWQNPRAFRLPPCSEQSEMLERARCDGRTRNGPTPHVEAAGDLRVATIVLARAWRVRPSGRKSHAPREAHRGETRVREGRCSGSRPHEEDGDGVDSHPDE